MDDAGRARIREQRVRDGAPTIGGGVHHVALICSDIERTIDFYDGLLGFPLVEIFENRDYPGSSHLFFDIGGRNLLAFFDFPGHPHPAASECLGGLQHLALSVGEDDWFAAKERLDAAGVPYVGPDRGANHSMYVKGPDGESLELLRAPLRDMTGTEPPERDVPSDASNT
jgi:glyoxylase I family protein